MLPFQDNWQPPVPAFQLEEPKPEPKKKRSLLSALLPTAGAALGGVIAAPFTGGLSLGATIAALGGASALGGAIGEFGAQKRSGEKLNVGNIAKEAAVSGAFGAGGQLLSGAKAVKTAKAAGSTTSLADALRSADAFQTVKATATATKGAGKLARASESLKKDVINPRTDASVFGAADDAKIVATVDKYVKGTNATSKYKNLETAFNGMSKDIEKRLASVSVTAPKDVLTTSIRSSLDDSVNFIPKDPAYERELTRVLKKVKSFGKAENMTPTEVFKAKQYLGSQLKGAFGKNGADLTVPQQVRMAVWDSLDNAITEIAPGVKDLTVAQSTLMKAAPGLKKASEKTLGVPLLGIKSKMAERLAQNAKTGAAGVFNTANKVTNATAPVRSELMRQALPRLIGGGYLSNNDTTNPTNMTTPQTMTQNDTIPNAMDNIDQQYSQIDNMSSDNPFDPANIEANIAQIMTNGGTTKDVNEYLSIVKTIQSLKPSSSTKPMSAEAAKSQSNALAGIEAINDFRSAITQDPSAFRNTILPGRSLFGGAVGNALGTGNIDAASQQIIDVIARLRTGAAISREEEARFKQFIPRPGDSQEVREQKLGYLERQFKRVAQDMVGAPSENDLTSLMASLGQ